MKKIIIPPVFLLISFILIVLFYFIFPQFNVIPFPYNLAGIFISFIGFGFTGLTWKLFRTYRTTLYFEKSSSMITEGIFGKTRNPMYIGMFLAILGISVCFMNILGMVIPFVFIILIRILFIPVEEKMMLETFGQEYINYKNRVRRWI